MEASLKKDFVYSQVIFIAVSFKVSIWTLSILIFTSFYEVTNFSYVLNQTS